MLEMTAEQYWTLPNRVRNTVEEMLRFYGKCHVWFEVDDDGNHFHITIPGDNRFPEYKADFKDFGTITKSKLPDMWAYLLKRESCACGCTVC